MSRLSREFHDDIARRLAAVAIESGTLEMKSKHITPMLAGELLQFHKGKPAPAEGKQAPLTAHRRKVLQSIAEGRATKEIATILKTVEFHKYIMMESLGLKSTAELIRCAVEHGI